MRKALVWVLAATFATSSAVALTTLVRSIPSVSGPSLQFEKTPWSLPHPLISGSEYDFQVEIMNRSDAPARLVGSLEFCGSACYSMPGLPITIPARGRGRVSLHVKAGRPGALSEEVTFYTDQLTDPTLVLRIEGTIVEGPGHDRPATPPAE